MMINPVRWADSTTEDDIRSRFGLPSAPSVPTDDNDNDDDDDAFLLYDDDNSLEADEDPT